MSRETPHRTEAPRGYYRHPTIHGDRIAFCSDDDLWIVGIAGGIARRLTTSRGPVLHPVFSPDGKWIAYAGREEGANEIYILPAEGGEPRRLTFLGANGYPLAWSRDGAEVIFASDTGRPFEADYHLCAVPQQGGPHRALRLGPAAAISFEPGGQGVAIGRSVGEPARWKRYRGGTAGTIWVDRHGDGRFSRILRSLEGNLAAPMWIAGRLYFLSDHEGIGNVYSVRPDGRGAWLRHTHQAEFYARFASTDGVCVVYHAGADLYVLDTRTGAERLIPVELRSPQPQRQRKFVSGSEFESYDPHPAGHSVLLTVRGRPVAMGLWEGPATEFGTPWRGRHRLARWLNDGRRIVAVTDEDGEETLEIFTPGQGVARVTPGEDLGRILDIVVAPAPPAAERRKRRGGRTQGDAKAARLDRIAVCNQRQELIVVDLARGAVRRIDRSEHARIQGIAWSPDARWIAYGFATGRRSRVIRVANADTGEWRQITSGDFIDFAPCFDPEGQYLYFLSLRTYDPVYDWIQFNIGFPRGAKPYLVTLREDQPSPFSPGPHPLGPVKDGQSSGQNPWEVSAARAEDSPGGRKLRHAGNTLANVRIDFAGIERRIVSFPVPEGRYADLRAIPGKVFFLAQPIEGTLGQSWLPGPPVAKASLEVFDLRELKGATFAEGVTGFAIAADRKTLLYQAATKLRAVLATAEPGKAAAGGDEPGRVTGWIDLGRVRCSVEPAAEWRQMLRETWRLQRDQFWVPDMSRVDWERVYHRYLPLIDRVSTRGELSDLIWEMQGELGTSHAYEAGGDYRRPPSYPVGFLGADVTYDPRLRAWKITRIPQADPWNPQEASPLSAPGLRIRPGTIIRAVNGRAVGAERSPQECLVHLAGQEVWLSIVDPSPAPRSRTHEEMRTVVVKTLRREYALRYRDWVESNRAWVHRTSRSRAGYVHIPDMSPEGFAEFHRYFLVEIDHPGLLIDVRHNGGGHVSELLLEKLLRRRVAYGVSRYATPEPYPYESPRGPLVAITDEMAGSDGDIFCQAWKLYRLGPLVGKRTWGGVIGISPRHALVDGTITTQPEHSFWFKDVGWGVENCGTVPDIEVDFRPQDHAAGRDPQLARALRVLEQLLRRSRETLPAMDRRPNLALPRLPRPPE